MLAVPGVAGEVTFASDYRQPLPDRFRFEKLTTPVRELYGGLPYPAVRRGAEVRWQSIRDAGNTASKQLIVADAALLGAVSAWLDSLFLESSP